jgi:hypothetical protein
MKRYNDTNTTIAVAIVVIAVVGGVGSGQAATVGYWRFEGSEELAVADGIAMSTTTGPVAICSARSKEQRHDRKFAARASRG